jgi:hypothetical protein
MYADQRYEGYRERQERARAGDEVAAIGCIFEDDLFAFVERIREHNEYFDLEGTA